MDLIWIEWEDSSTLAGWADELATPAYPTTVGHWVLDNDEEGYTVVCLSRCIDQDQAEFSSSIAIPYSAIKAWGWLQ
jgi:hypothetical protein